MKHDFEIAGDFATCRGCGLRVRRTVAGRSIDLSKIGNPCSSSLAPGPWPLTPSSGLGTRIAKVLAFFGLKKCRRCGEREKKLNRWFPW